MSEFKNFTEECICFQHGQRSTIVYPENYLCSTVPINDVNVKVSLAKSEKIDVGRVKGSAPIKVIVGSAVACTHPKVEDEILLEILNAMSKTTLQKQREHPELVEYLNFISRDWAGLIEEATEKMIEIKQNSDVIIFQALQNTFIISNPGQYDYTFIHTRCPPFLVSDKRADF